MFSRLHVMEMYDNTIRLRACARRCAGGIAIKAQMRGRCEQLARRVWNAHMVNKIVAQQANDRIKSNKCRKVNVKTTP